MSQMSRVISAVVVPVILAQALAACAAGSPSDLAPPAEAVMTVLPTPVLTSDWSLEESLASRRSAREYSPQALTTEEIGQLLWAAQGITSQEGYRTAPSAGALYPLEVYLATAEGVFRYDPLQHRLVGSSQDDTRTALHQAALQQEPVLKAPAVFVITAIYARTSLKYGEERSPRYVHMEAGHAAQNLLLQATALGLGAVPIGAFDDREVQQSLGLPADRQPLYLIPVGHPASPGR